MPVPLIDQPEGIERYNFKRKGRNFLIVFAALTLLLAGAYISAHVVVPAATTVIPPEKLVRILPNGLAEIRSAEDLIFTLGEETALAHLGTLQSRNTEIAAVNRQLSEMRLTFADEFGSTLFDGGVSVTNALSAHDFERALQALAELRRGISPGSITMERVRFLSRLEVAISQAGELHRQQKSTQSALHPPQKYLVFWMSPSGILLEVAFWSIFGVLAGLLYHTAQHIAQGTYAPKEQAVAWTKLLYTPFVALALVFSLWAGIIELGGPETRAWSIPLIGFLAGFNTRKAVELLDRIGNWVFTRAGHSLDRPEGQPTATQAATTRAFKTLVRNAPAESLAQVSAEAKSIAQEEIRRELSTLESQT